MQTRRTWSTVLAWSGLGLCVLVGTVAQAQEGPEGPELIAPAPMDRSSLAAPSEEVPGLEELLPPSSRSLTQAQALDLMEKSNLDLKAVQERLEQSALLRSRAFALLIPNANVQAAFTVFDSEVVLEQPPVTVPDENGVPQVMEIPPVVVRPQFQFSVTGTLRSTFDARIFSLLDSAKYAEESAALSREQLLQQLQYGVLISIHQLDTLQTLMEIGRSSVSARYTLLQAAQGRLDSGVGTRFEVTRAKVELSKARRDLQSLSLSYIKAREALALILTTEPDFTIASVEPMPEPASLQDLQDRALEMNPGLKVARKNMDLRDAALKTTYWSYAPNLIGQLQATQQPETIFAPGFQWTAQIIASWNLYDGGQRSAQVDEDQSNIRLAELELEKQERQVSSSLRQAWQDVSNRKLQIATAKQEVDLSTEALQQAQDGYKLGAVTQLEVLNSEIQLRISRTQLANEELAYQIALTDLYRLSGQKITP